MIVGLEELRDCIQDTLDDLCSPRTSSDVKIRALETLEKQLAASCLSSDKSDECKESWDHFLALQYTFECNVPSRLMAWISATTPELELVVSKATPEERLLTSQLTKALCIIQGIALSHGSSKKFLGRKYSLEVLLELLLVSRHLAPPTESERSGSTGKKQPTNLPLTSTILDTLLCILVDSPQALRAFESANGVQAVVRILKRAGTPREVRMKCLEFLYFYLLDETLPTEVIRPQRSTSTASTISAISIISNSTSYLETPPPQVAPPRLPKPSLNPAPLRPTARHGSGSSELSSSSSSSRSASGSSTHSFTSMSSNSTPASSISSSSNKSPGVSQTPSRSRTPFNSPPSTFQFPTPQHRNNAMMMLKKEVDYEPLSPRKPSFGDRVTTPSRPRAQTHGQLYTPSRSYTHTSQLPMSTCDSELRHDNGHEKNNEKRMTTEEKKKLLGTMLGNVDALVEGVRKAGIWGLA